MDPHDPRVVKECTVYIRKLKTIYGSTVNIEQTIEEIRQFLDSQSSSIIRNLDDARKTYDKYALDQSADPSHHKYKTADDCEAIRNMGVDFKTAFVLEWKAFTDPRNFYSPADLYDRQISFLSKMASIEEESREQGGTAKGRDYISAMGVFTRICSYEYGGVTHKALEELEVDALLANTLTTGNTEHQKYKEEKSTTTSEERKSSELKERESHQNINTIIKPDAQLTQTQEIQTPLNTTYHGEHKVDINGQDSNVGGDS